MKKINILQLVTGLTVGGAENVVLNLARYTSKERFNTYVLSLSKKEELLPEFLKYNIDTTLLRKSNSLLDFISMLKSLHSFVKENHIQVIHAHMFHSLLLASLVKLFNPSLKIIYTSHSLSRNFRLNQVIIFLMKPLRDIDIIFSKEILRFFYKKTYKIIPNGVKLEQYQMEYPKYDTFTFIAVGRLTEAKNHQFLIEFAKLLKEKYHFEIHIVGDGELREELERMIEASNLQKEIKLLGLRNDIPKLLKQSHALLMPSLWEGLPLVILEAGASHLPIISTPVGSIPSLLNNENAYLCELSQFVSAAEEILKNSDESNSKAEKLFEKISSSYSLGKIIKVHEEIYQSV